MKQASEGLPHVVAQGVSDEHDLLSPVRLQKIPTIKAVKTIANIMNVISSS